MSQANLPVWASRSSEAWSLSIRVVPGSRRTEVAGVLGEQLRIKVAAPPNDGKANDELLSFLASTLGIRARDLRIARGRHGRSKVVQVTADLDPATVSRLGA